MMYYLEKDGEIVRASESQAALYNTIAVKPEFKGLEIQESETDLVLYNDKWYFVNDEEYLELLNHEEQVRIAHLHLTRGDVFRGLLLAKGVTRDQIRTMIQQMPEETQEQKVAKELALIDFDEALDFYRGVALIDTIGAALGVSKEQMTHFFETGDYKALITPITEA